MEPFLEASIRAQGFYFRNFLILTKLYNWFLKFSIFIKRSFYFDMLFIFQSLFDFTLLNKFDESLSLSNEKEARNEGSLYGLFFKKP